MSVLDEEFAARHAPGHTTGERDVVEITRTALLHERQRGDALAARQVREQNLLLMGAAGDGQ